MFGIEFSTEPFEMFLTGASTVLVLVIVYRVWKLICEPSKQEQEVD